jgi:hypothetical protein
MISNKDKVIKAAYPFVSPCGIGAAGGAARNGARGPARPAGPPASCAMLPGLATPGTLCCAKKTADSRPLAGFVVHRAIHPE